MKRIFTICLVLLLCASAFAVPRTADRDERGAFTGPRSGVDLDDNIKALLDVLYRANAISRGTGSIFYVDTNVATAGDGSVWSEAEDNLDDAINRCTAANGDEIHVAEGSVFNIAAISAIAADVAGVKIKGHGRGNLRPQIVFWAGSAEFGISASCVEIDNFYFRAVSNIRAAINVHPAGVYFRITNCLFDDVASSVGAHRWSHFGHMINIASRADYGYIGNNEFRGGIAHYSKNQFATVSTAIRFDQVSGLIIEDNYIWGDFQTDCIQNVSLLASAAGGHASGILLKNNILINGNLSGDSSLNEDQVLTFANETGGLAIGNSFIGSGETYSKRTADDFIFVNNTTALNDGDEFSGFFESMFGRALGDFSVVSSIVDN